LRMSCGSTLGSTLGSSSIRFFVTKI